jgi:hypothetical protein
MDVNDVHTSVFLFSRGKVGRMTLDRPWEPASVAACTGQLLFPLRHVRLDAQLCMRVYACVRVRANMRACGCVCECVCCAIFAVCMSDDELQSSYQMKGK